MEENIYGPTMYIDLDELKKFIFNDDEDGRQSDVEITETQDFDENGKLLGKTKVTREVKSVNDAKQTLRYDLIKTFLSALTDAGQAMGLDNEEDGYVYISPFQGIAFNTLYNYGIIKDLSQEKEKDEE